MKQLTLKPTGRKAFFTDIIDAQNEPLEALQTFFEPYGACIISGCEVTVAHTTGGIPDLWDIAAGMVALNHADGFKICRFAGATGVVFSGGQYLSCTKTPISANYVGGPDDGAYDYTAELNAGPVPTPGDPLYLELFDTANETRNLQFADAFASKAVTGWQALTLTGATGSLKCAINKSARLLYLQGNITVTGVSGNGIVAQILAASPSTGLLWPIGFQPTAAQWFKAFRYYDPGTGANYFLEPANKDYVTDADCFADGSGLTILVRRLATATSIQLYINAVLQLD